LLKQVFDLVFGFIADPVVDLFPRRLGLVNEICQMNSRAVVECDGVEKVRLEWVSLLRPDGIGNVEFHWLLVFARIGGGFFECEVKHIK